MNKQSEFTEKIVDKITALGLNTPAVLLLEAHKPLAFIGGQLLLVAQPTLNLLWPRNPAGELSSLLSDSTRLEQLITSLEARAMPDSTSQEAGRDG